MKVCIAGGGRVGRYLAQSLLANRHEIVIIEPVESQCRMLADMLDIPVICGDSISVDTLRTADVASCDAFVAVTGSDEDNLVACQIAKREFGVDRTVARASNPKNRELLRHLSLRPQASVSSCRLSSRVRQRMWSQGSRIVLPWGMMNSVSRVMLIRMVSPGMGMSMMALPA